MELILTVTDSPQFCNLITERTYQSIYYSTNVLIMMCQGTYALHVQLTFGIAYNIL